MFALVIGVYCEAIEVVVVAAADAPPVSSVFVNVSSSISVAVDTVDCSAALPFRVFPVVVAVFVFVCEPAVASLHPAGCVSDGTAHVF